MRHSSIWSSQAGIVVITAMALGGCATTGGNGQAALDAVSKGGPGASAPAVIDALREAPHDPRTQLAAALYYDGQNRPNLARQYYQAVILGRQPVMVTVVADQPPRSAAAVAAQKLAALGQEPMAAGRQSRADQWAALTPIVPSSAPTSTPTRLTPGVGVFALDPVVQRYVIFIQLVEAGIASEEEYQARRRANLGGLLPYSSSALAPADRQLPPTADEIRQRIQDIDHFATTMGNAEGYRETRRREILDGLLPLNSSATAARAVSAEWPKDRVISLTAAGLVTTEEMQREVMSIYAAQSGTGKDRKAASPYISNRPWVSR